MKQIKIFIVETKPTSKNYNINNLSVNGLK
jgi:hypothetical protein